MRSRLATELGNLLGILLRRAIHEGHAHVELLLGGGGTGAYGPVFISQAPAARLSC